MKDSKFRNEIRKFFTALRIYKNTFTAFLFHHITAGFMRDMTDFSRKVVINSNVNYYEKTCTLLIDSLLKSGVKKEDIILMIGGADKKEKFTYYGVESYFLDNNSIDYTSFIGIIELGLTDNIDFFFYIHDTALICSKRFSTVFYKYPLKTNYTYSIATFISMNIGFYSKESLITHKDLIFSGKNNDYSYEGVYNSKIWGIKMEDQIFRNNSQYHKTIFGGYSFPTEKMVEYVGQQRIEETYKGVSILKYKINKNITENFIVSLNDKSKF